ncbi:hypothetical protein CDIK_3317 [Cucumispora dikerogammari]|nr:hypothetical protein CDIK_3317 [Cucumispora dikerogammari]
MWKTYDTFYDYQKTKDNCVRYVEGYRKVHDNKIRGSSVEVGDKVLIAKALNPVFKRKRKSLESYYEERVFVIQTVFQNFFKVKKISENQEKKTVHKSMIKKISI